MNSGMKSPEGKFSDQAEQADASFLAEFIYFLKNNKKWWQIPILIVLLLLGGLMLLGGTSLAPFIYTLF